MVSFKNSSMNIVITAMNSNVQIHEFEVPTTLPDWVTFLKSIFGRQSEVNIDTPQQQHLSD